MTESKERRFRPTELRYITITCKQCAGEIRFDAMNPKQRANLTGNLPHLACPFCAQDFDSKIRALLHGFAMWQEGAKDFNTQIAFVVPDEA